jgi:hypothetical protein
MVGNLFWNTYLGPEDVKYIVASLAVDWAKDLDMNAYSAEFDDSLPSIKFSASELAPESDNVIH